MQFTMKNLLEIEAIKPAQVRSGRHSLNKRFVESVSVIEMPVENFVRKNEFVLTTAIGCGEPSAFLKFVEDIYHSEAAAVAVATGRHVFNIPDLVLDYADRNDFPILEIPWEVRFADITQAVFGELYKRHHGQLDRSEHLQRQLLHLFLEGASLSEAAEMIRLETGLPILILDKHGNIKGQSQEAGSLFSHWSRFLINQDTHRIGKEQLIEYSGNKFQVISETLCCFKIITMDTIQGYLLLNRFLNDKIADSRGRLQTVEYAVTAASLWFQREEAVYDAEFRLKDEFVWNLAKEETGSWEIVNRRAAFLNYNLSLPYVCIIGTPEQVENLYLKNTLRPKSYEHWKHQFIRLVEEQIGLAGNALQLKTINTFQDEWFIIFLEVPPHDMRIGIQCFLDVLENHLNKMFPGIVLSWGIGENNAGIRKFHESFNTARIALEIGRKQKGPGSRSTYRNTSLSRALLNLSDNSEIQEITLSVIGPLIAYDNERGLDLIHTLNLYIRNQGNVSQASRALNLHRQSLLYRLRKIETLTGRSLEDPDDLFLLDLSMKLWTSGVMSNLVNPKE